MKTKRYVNQRIVTIKKSNLHYITDIKHKQGTGLCKNLFAFIFFGNILFSFNFIVIFIANFSRLRMAAC